MRKQMASDDEEDMTHAAFAMRSVRLVDTMLKRAKNNT
jgi:hypothetical protein